MNKSTPDYTVAFVTSRDGTKIAYRQSGAGPGLILVHGAMMTSRNFIKLAAHLSAHFTVYIPDRQGRGLSESHGEHFGLVKEAEDMQALAAQTGTQNIFGLSSGAIIALQTAIMTPALRKVALYEPPIPADHTMHADWYSQYEDAILKGNFGKAFVTIIKGTSDASLFTRLPTFITAPLFNFVIKRHAARPGSDEMPLSALIAAFRYDYRVMRESEDIISKVKNMDAAVLLLGGVRSQGYLKAALDRLAVALPHAQRVEFPGLGHIAADNSGRPEVVAEKLNDFFALPA